MNQLQLALVRAKALQNWINEMKQPNPNAGTTARSRRILRNLRSFPYASSYPIRAERLVDDNGRPHTVLSYRTEIVAKKPEENLLARLREFSLRQLLRRQTQGEHALSRAKAKHERAETPAEKGSLWPQVTRCQNFVDAVNAEIARRGSEAEHLERLANLTPREIQHKISHGHKAMARAHRRQEHCAIPSLAIRMRESSAIHHRNVTLTTALRAKQNERN